MAEPNAHNPPAVLPPRRPSRAAAMVWIVGALQALCLGCCSLGVAMSYDMLLEEMPSALSQIPADQAPPEQVEALSQALPALLVAGAIVSALFALAGVVLLLLGFGVRRGSRAAIIAALVILGLEAVPLGLMLLIALPQALLAGAIGDMLVQMIVMGGFLAMLVATFMQLLRDLRRPSRGAQPTPALSDEPWNDHLRGW